MALRVLPNNQYHWLMVAPGLFLRENLFQPLLSCLFGYNVIIVALWCCCLSIDCFAVKPITVMSSELRPGVDKYVSPGGEACFLAPRKLSSPSDKALVAGADVNQIHIL
ncbi:hypothetical protein EVAR_71993_1 [Eumeta japonica]|uniref:Uncharacterized protein n=1 Tax=Eumeta variegata TaxID=151549 RepID=A0A4C1TAU1_EUMVA|nr:hypothetical protein EVAR_71993_1 [Eumeta japonica]